MILVYLQTTKPDVVMAVTAPGVTFEGLNLNLEMAVWIWTLSQRRVTPVLHAPFICLPFSKHMDLFEMRRRVRQKLPRAAQRIGCWEPMGRQHAAQRGHHC